jgi:hypothetical protein
MSQTLSRMERLARAEEERKRFRQAAASNESSALQPASVPVSESASFHQPTPVKLESETQALKQTSSPSLGAQHSQPSDAPEITIASETIVALDTTVAQETTVAPNATVAQETRVAPGAPVEIRGYGPFTWDLLDGIMPRLDPYEQVVLLRLCRLAWGHKKDTCRVGYDRLQQACNLKKRKLQEVISKLEFLRYIRRLALEQGGSDRSLRGTEYQILLTPPPGVLRTTVARDTTVASDATVASGATNKKNALKENSKEDVPSRANECPDCGGTSWFYPKGAEGGVKRCSHPKVPKAGK